SRRRHTRSTRDWSSDVCSSDLGALFSAHVGASLLFEDTKPCHSRPVLVSSTKQLTPLLRANWYRPASDPAGARGTSATISPAMKIGRASCRDRGEVGASGIAVQ